MLSPNSDINDSQTITQVTTNKYWFANQVIKKLVQGKEALFDIIPPVGSCQNATNQQKES